MDNIINSDIPYFFNKILSLKIYIAGNNPVEFHKIDYS